MNARVDAAPGLAAVARLIADESRAAICVALLDQRAWTAGELARYAGVARSTATEHLNLLVAAGVAVEVRQGRHRYVSLAGPQVAELVEALAAQIPPGPHPATLRASSARSAPARARTCYDHLAGSLGVAVTKCMAERGLLDCTGGWKITGDGFAWLAGIGVDVESLRSGGRPMARACLDWTERRHHLAGSAGAAICDLFIDLGWVARVGTYRAVRVTTSGRQALARHLRVDWGVEP